MAEKCEICNEKIEENELGKLEGTGIKVNKNTRTGFVYICSDCQKQGKDKELKK